MSDRTLSSHAARLARRAPAVAPPDVPPLPGGPFDIVYADPPWSYYGSPVKDAAAAKHYALMSQSALAELPVREIMSRRAALFLWATGPRLHYAIELIERWRLHFRGVLYVWVKTNRRGQIIRGQGIPPTFTKPTSEFVLAATTMRGGRPFPLRDLAQAQVVLAPRGEHSRKPDVFRTMIEQLCGKRPRIELFAREPAPGWVSWGAQSQNRHGGTAQRRRDVNDVVLNPTHTAP
ncbi:MAG: DNA methyltransferase [Candidatus Eremiobacteraeota bacterium]|nr:DNA methyltransferase [Candidatus Eremiobacteraeota bacterium]